MDGSQLYHEGSREIQDRLERVTLHRVFAGADRELIESAPMFLLARESQ